MTALFSKIHAKLKSIQWDQTRLFDAASAHIGWAGFATIGFYCFGHVPFYCILLSFLLFALVKEYLIDLTIEKGETVWSSTVDFITYQLGVLLGGITILNVWAAFFAAVLLLVGMVVLDYYGFFKFIEDLSEEPQAGNRYGNPFC